MRYALIIGVIANSLFVFAPSVAWYFDDGPRWAALVLVPLAVLNASVAAFNYYVYRKTTPN